MAFYGMRKGEIMKTKLKWIIPAVSAAVLAAVGGILALTGVFGKKGPDEEKKDKFVLAAAVYPEFKQKPVLPDVDWEDEEYIEEHYEELEAMLEKYDETSQAYAEELLVLRKELSEYGREKALGTVAKFTEESMITFLSNRNGENRVYSPINLYLMLGMLSEVTDGNSRKQLLELANADTAEDLRARSKALFDNLYKDDPSGTCRLGASFWLSDAETGYKKKTLDILAKEYYASSFSGKMGSAEYNKQLHKWINSQTGNLLEDAVNDLEFKDYTVFALVTTLFLDAKWEEQFNESRTEDDIFHAESGDVTVPFMHEAKVGSYYTGDRFTAVAKNLATDFYVGDGMGEMMFILPNEGVSVDELLTDPQVMEYIMQSYMYLNRNVAKIHLSVPRFDISYKTDIISNLKALGVTDIFQAGTADFSPLLDDPLFVDEAKHAARVMVDENGVKAAAFTFVTETKGAAMEEKDFYFTLDRPFLFVIRSEAGIPLFVGVVENP